MPFTVERRLLCLPPCNLRGQRVAADDNPGMEHLTVTSEVRSENDYLCHGEKSSVGELRAERCVEHSKRETYVALEGEGEDGAYFN